MRFCLVMVRMLVVMTVTAVSDKQYIKYISISSSVLAPFSVSLRKLKNKKWMQQSNSSFFPKKESCRIPCLVQKNELTHSVSQEERQLLHPLERNDPVLVDHVDFVTLEFLEIAKHPIPKNQLLNKQEAFGELTGRSVLVALSHGWFYQMHPDPHAVKIDIIVKEFGPRLRKTYPETQILFFFDFLSVPQWPRTDAEDKIFRVAMKHMNSVYVYCDLVLFIETDLPKVDQTLHDAAIRVSDYKWTQFLGKIELDGISMDFEGRLHSGIVFLAIGIDLGVELAVFAGTVLALGRIYPSFSAFRILMGLVRSSGGLMLAGTINTWLVILTFQNTRWFRPDSKIRMAGLRR